jgi:hypothetical protein
MDRKSIKGLFVLLSVFLSSYLINFLWESLHAVFLYQDHDFNAEKYVLMVSYVSAIDALLILGIYLLVAALWRDMVWIRSMNAMQIATVVVTGLVAAGAIEYRRVFVTKTWSYTQLMPTIFGLGVSPLLQLSLTGLLAFWLSGKVMYQKETPER